MRERARACRSGRDRGWRDRTAPGAPPRGARPDGGHRQRSGRPDRRLPAATHRYPGRVVRSRGAAGRPRAHPGGDRRRRADDPPRHRVPGAQRAHLPPSDRALPRVGRGHQAERDEHVRALPGLRAPVRGRPGPGRAVRAARPGAARRLPADAHRGAALPPPGPPPAGRHRARRGRRHAHAVPHRRRVLVVLHQPLHDAAGLGRLVLRAGSRGRVPGPLPVRVPRQPRPARRHRLAGLADGRRRLPQLRRQGRRPADRRPPGHPRPRRPAPPGRGRDHHRGR